MRNRTPCRWPIPPQWFKHLTCYYYLSCTSMITRSNTTTCCESWMPQKSESTNAVMVLLLEIDVPGYPSGKMWHPNPTSACWLYKLSTRHPSEVKKCKQFRKRVRLPGSLRALPKRCLAVLQNNYHLLSLMAVSTCLGRVECYWQKPHPFADACITGYYQPLVAGWNLSSLHCQHIECHVHLLVNNKHPTNTFGWNLYAGFRKYFLFAEISA